MALKTLIFAAILAAVHAGGPASYAISAPSLDHYSVGHSNEHTVKGLYGQNVLSTYSKAVDTPHSSVRVTNSKATNDVLGHGIAAYPGYHAPLAAPVLKAAPALAYPGYHGPYGAPYGAPYGSPYAAHGLAYPGLGYPGLHGPLAGPVLKAPVAAVAPVASVSFHGLGAHYGW